MLKQWKFLGHNVNMNYTKLHEIENLQMKCKQSLWKLIYFKLQFKMCDGMTEWQEILNMEHRSQVHGYALGLKKAEQKIRIATTSSCTKIHLHIIIQYKYIPHLSLNMSQNVHVYFGMIMNMLFACVIRG